MNTTEEIPKSELIAQILAEERTRLQQTGERLDAYAGIMLKLPPDILDRCAPTYGWLQICAPKREQVEVILSCLNAGRWEKKASSGTLGIDYEGMVDGVLVLIHNAEPPKSCRIEEVTTYVPAHNRTDRKLVCA